ncbi:J domain-containing protein [bacterium]|nr:J domain-containing protein [bacterium]
MDIKDYYKILGVGEKASASDIKSAYRMLAKQYHPDTNPGDKKAEEKFKAISEAYNVLSDPKKKSEYDQMRKYGFRGGGFHGRNYDFGSFHRAGTSEGPGGFSFEGFDFMGDLGSIFDHLFKGASPFQKARPRPVRGHDIHVKLTIPLEKAVQGGKASFLVQKEDTCPICEGGGARPGSTVKTCPKCQGRGRISSGSPFLGASQKVCPHCYGKGHIIENPCRRCQGSGTAKVKKNYTINIPAGITEQEQIRLKGQGEKDPSGLPPGNMYVTVQIKSHRFFQPRGRNVHCIVEINPGQAAEGTTIQVKTVHGNKVRLKIPPGTNSGTTLRIPNMGIGKPGKRGDQLVTVQVVNKQKQAV